MATKKFTRRWYLARAAETEARAAGYAAWARGEGQAAAADAAERARYTELAGVYAESAARDRELAS